MRFSGTTAGVIVASAMALCAAIGTPVDAATEDWNDGAIKWMGYEEGLAAAKAGKKPVCLVFYTTWCPHCANYSKVFKDQKVVDKSKSFVMIRLDKDKNKEISAQYKPDGEYIPRTYFLSPDGKLDESLTAERPQFKYFYAENDPASILGGMDRALQKLK
jgi:thiol:disulfide interchange protein